MNKFLLKLYSLLCKIRHRIKSRYIILIGYGVRIINPHKIDFKGDFVKVYKGCIINAHGNGTIAIGGGTSIGYRTQIYCNNKVIIEDKVLIAPDVFITDHNHEYTSPFKAICDQGQREKNNVIEIGKGSWIGTKVTIVGDIKIGKNCVIGANSVITKSIPDYCVAAGCPAKIIKKYDAQKNEWVSF